MRPLYLVAVIGTRLIGFLLILILSYLMEPEAFGRFTLINTNALFLQMVAGSWLVAITNRTLVSNNDIVDQKMLSAVFSAALGVIALLVAATVFYVSQNPGQALQAIATTVLASLLIIYDTTLAVKNAVGRESGYAALALLRNGLALSVAVALVLLGAGALGPIYGLIIGTIAALLLMPGTRSLWSAVRPSWQALRAVAAKLRLGIAGGLILGAYILVSAPPRNIIAHLAGVPEAGVWALCVDLFFGPLVIVGNAYALSQVRLIYLAASRSDHADLDRHARSLIEFTLAIAVPYVIGGVLFAEEATRLILPGLQARLAAGVAGPAAVQAAVVLGLYNLSTIALARNRLWLVAGMVLSTALAAALAALAGDNFVQMARFSVAASAAAILLWLIWSVAAGLVQLRLREMAKLLVAASALLAVSIAGLRLLPFIDQWIVATAGAAAFISVAVGLGVGGFIDVLPSAIRHRIGRAECQVKQ